MMSPSTPNRLKEGSIVKLVGVLLLVSVLSVCSGARAIEIVQKPMGGSKDHNFLELGESEVLLNWDGTREGNVCNAEKTLWAMNYHWLSDCDDFDLALEGKDKTVLLIGGVGGYIDAALRKKKIVPDLPYHHSYTNAVSIDGNVITCDFSGYGQKGEYERKFKVLVTEVKDGVTLEPYAMNAPIASAPKMKRGHLPPGVVPRKSSKQATTKQTDTSLSSGTATAAIVKRPFHVNDEKATEQNFLVVGDWRVLLPLHTQTSENLCNAEKTLWALPYGEGQNADAFDVVARTKSGRFVVIPSVTPYVLAARNIVPWAGEFNVSTTLVSVENDVISGRIDGEGYKDSKMEGKEYHARFEVRVKEAGQNVHLEPVVFEQQEQTPAAQ